MTTTSTQRHRLASEGCRKFPTEHSYETITEEDNWASQTGSKFTKKRASQRHQTISCTMRTSLGLWNGASSSELVSAVCHSKKLAVLEMRTSDAEEQTCQQDFASCPESL